MPTTLGKYQLGMTLGEGVSCKVKLAKDNTGTRYAVKVLHNDPEFLELIQAEINTLKELKHPNIVNLIESGKGIMANQKKSPKEVDYIVLELVNGGDLFDFVANSGRFSEEVSRYYFNQFVDALDYMHQNNCCHRDLKPENIMLDSEFNLKVADFGFAAPVSGRDGSGFLTTTLGTQSYMAPEIHLQKPYTGPGVDLFAAAIILFVMMSQRPPFNSPKPDDPHYRLLAADRADLFWKAHDEVEEGGSIYSDEFKDLFEKMTKLNPAQRINMEGIKKHPWYLGAKSSKSQITQEFENRKKEVDKEANQERDSKRAERAERKHGATHRGYADLDEDQKLAFDEQLEIWKKYNDESEEGLKLPDYEEVIKKQTTFFSTADCDKIAFDLYFVLMDELEAKPTLIGQNAKMKFELNDKRLGSQPIKVTVKFYHVPKSVDDECDKVCVEFVRKAGDQLIWFEKYKLIMEQMKDYRDATLI